MSELDAQSMGWRVYAVSSRSRYLCAFFLLVGRSCIFGSQNRAHRRNSQSLEDNKDAMQLFRDALAPEC